MASSELIVGAIVCFATETHCAWTTLDGDQFRNEIKWTRNALPTNTPDSAFAAAIGYFKNSGVRLDALTISLYGIVAGLQFFGGTQENWIDGFDIWEKLTEHGVGTILNPTNREPSDRKAHVLCNNDSGLAAIAEYLWGSGSSIRKEIKNSEQHNMAYFKVREGIGSGVILAGRVWKGARQPEMGHIPIRRAKNDDYPGLCPFHDDCVEGLASSAAMIQRLSGYSGDGKVGSLKELDGKPDHEIWQLEGYYLGELALIADLVVAPRRIIFEGDVIRPHLIEKIRACYKESADEYPKQNVIPDFISTGEFRGTDATLLGALELSRQNAIKLARKNSKYITGGQLIYDSDGESKFDESLKLLKDIRKKTFGPTRARDTLTTYHAPKSKWIFGLSIAETVEWVIGQATDGKLDKGFQHGILCPDMSLGLMPVDKQNPIYIQQHILEGLQRLRVERDSSGIFSRNIEGIGVSTIGVVNSKDRTLESIARKAWVPLPGNKAVVDFGELFHVQDEFGNMIFPIDTVRNRLSVQNDAPARCLTEYMYGFDGKERPESLLYLMIGEGVNGAVLSDGDLPHAVGHPEFGHSLPRLHEIDINDDPNLYTGCPAHTTCFEGIASNARFRRQKRFGYNIGELEGKPLEDALKIEAFYLSQLVINGVLMFSPHRVIIGGGIMHGAKGLRLLEEIYRQFETLNANYLPDYKTFSSIEKLIKRSDLGDMVRPLSAFMVGSLAAFGGERFAKTLTVKELSRRAALWADGR